ncbi:hypothetical protein [Scopulibacillus cellulosilyticus]|uniref:Abortive infection bacteriophage resistance protein n=1 Tax=Scopulibacillus cellulosilyticus TaxID=2665665 RepID=A0ABW2PUW4_9BACL
MDILSLIKTHYYFENAAWSREHEPIIETGTEKKKVYFWRDFNTLQWHINWRHRLYCDAFYVDRMLVTGSGQLFIPFESGGFLTCHDVLEERADLEGNEKSWGQFIGTVLNRSMVPAKGYSQLLSQNIEKTYQTFEYMHRWQPQINSAEYQMIKRCVPTVGERIRKMKSLLRQNELEYVPYTTAFLPVERGKWLSGKLFWEIGQSTPVIGYRTFSDFLKKWLMATNEKSFYNLVETVDKISPLNRHAHQLLADLYFPDEWQRMVDNLRFERQQILFEQFKTEWDATSRTTTFFYQFLKEQGYVL